MEQWTGHLVQRETRSVVQRASCHQHGPVWELRSAILQTHGWTEVFLHVYHNQSRHKRPTGRCHRAK